MPVPTKTLGAIKKAWGENAASYFSKGFTDRRYIASLRRRASSLNVRGERLRLSLAEDDDFTLDLGGTETNDLMVAAPVDVAASPDLAGLLSRQLGREVTPDHTSAVFIVRRQFDAVASREHAQPVLAYSERLHVLVRDSAGKRPSRAEAIVLDQAGVHRTFSAGPEVLTAPPPTVRQIDAIVPHRRTRVNAYTDRLVGYGPQGRKVYLKFREADRPTPSRRAGAESQRAGALRQIQKVEHMAVEITGVNRPPGAAGGGRKAAMMVLDGSDTAEASLEQLAADEMYQVAEGGQTYQVVGTMALSPPPDDRPIIISWFGYGPPGSGGYGDPRGLAQGSTSFSCFGFDQKDECTNCCITKAATITASIVGASVACAAAASWTGIGAVLCALTGLAFIAIVVALEENCRGKCQYRYEW